MLRHAEETAVIPFTKMHGLGNDFVLIEEKALAPYPKLDLEALATKVCDRHFGIGADGLIVVTRPADTNRFQLRFVYLNGDGSWAEMCGNGIRCFARFAKDHGYVEQDTFTVETLAGPIRPQVHADGTVTVDMGAPIFAAEQIPFSRPKGFVSQNTPVQGMPSEDGDRVIAYPLNVLEETLPVTLVSMGNPHCLVFTEDLDSPVDPAVFGPAMEKHPAFPKKTNVEFIDVLDRQTLKVTVWERGCGFTLACGTGACASAVGAVLQGKVQPEPGKAVEVRLPGGSLFISWEQGSDNHVFMTGPASYVFTGTIEVPMSILQAANGRGLQYPQLAML